MTGPDVQVPIEILLCAFRYALGRRTGAVEDVASTVECHREAFPGWMRQQMERDIASAIAHDQAGAPCDIDTWRRVEKTLRSVET